MKLESIINIAYLSLICYSCSDSDLSTDNNNRLWYTYPAKYWNSQALHLGNGYFGASFFGGTQEELIAISEKSMWTGSPAEGNWTKAGVNPKANQSLPFIRKAILDRESRKADSLIANDFFGSSELYGSFTSVGDLKIKFLNHESAPYTYKRELDLANSVGTIHYNIENTSFKREYFCSYPDRLLAMKFSANKPKKISFRLTMDIMQDSSSVEISGNTFKVRGFINKNYRPFVVLIHVKNEGGIVNSEGDFLSVRDADSVELYLTVATNYEMKYPDYTGSDPEEITNGIMQGIA